MKRLATWIFLAFFLFVPNSVASNRDRHDERLPELYELLKKGDAREKQSAMYMIRVLHDPEYHKDKFINPILKLLNDKSPKVREAAVAKFKQLAQDYSGKFYKSDIATNDIVPSLIKALSDKAASVRREAAKALGYYRDQRAVKPLILLLQDHNFQVCFETIHALGRVNPGAEAVVPLMNIIAVDDAWPTRLLQQEALKALVFILQQNTVTIQQKKAKERYFKNGITIRKTLIDPRIRGKIISILSEKRNDPYLRAGVIKMLGAMHIQIGEQEAEKAIKYLIASTSDSIAQIRKLAWSSLSSITYSCDRTDDKTTRNSTIQKYRSMVTDFCISSLKDPSAEVRKKAADILGRSEDPKAVQPLITALNDKNQDMKVAVINALGRFNDAGIIDPLLETLSDENDTVRISAIDVLGHYNDFKAVKALPTYFGSFNSNDDNASVGRIFGKIAEATKEGIRLVYHYNGKRYVCKIDDTGSAVIPGNVDISSIKKLMRHPIAVESIFRALKNPDFKGQLQALKMLRRFEDERIADHIMSFLYNSNPKIREASLSLVYLSIDSDNAMSIIKRALKDKNAAVQKEAQTLFNVLVAANVKSDNSIEEKIAALNSRDATLRLTAVKALSQLNDKQAVGPLIEHLNDANVQVRRAVIDALKHLKDTRAVEPLLALTDDKRVRIHAASALSWFDDPRVADFFLEQLHHQDQKLVLEAVKYFERHPDQRTVKFLIPLLKSSYKTMPSWAAGALGNSGDKRAVEPLIDLLTMKLPEDDKEKKQVYRYKRSALNALAKFDDKRLYPLFINALKDKQLKQDAILALSGLKDKRAVPILLKHLSDSSPFIKSFAIRSLGEIGDASLFDSIEPFLSDPYEPIAKSAFHTAFRLDPERAQEKLMGLLDIKDPVAFERNLKLIGCSEAKHIILKLAELSAGRKGFDAVIGKKLSQCNNQEITDILISDFKKENEPDIRVALIDILGKLDNPKIKELLTQYLNDPDPLIRRHVKTALEESKDVIIATLSKDDASFGLTYNRGRIKGKNNYTVMPLSQLTVEHISGGGQERVISGNVEFPVDPRIKKIIEDYKFDGYKSVSLEIENPVKSEKLIPRLKDTDPAGRQEAVEYLGYFGNVTATPSIILLLKDRNPTVRLAAARALGLMKSRSAFSHLVDFLHDPDVNVTSMAAWALGEINDEKALIPLSTLMKKNQKLRIKENCMKTTAKIGQKAERDVLTASLTETKDYRIRMLAVDAIGRLGDTKMMPFLQSRLQDPNEYVRQALARWIGDLSGKEAVPLLTNYLNDPDFYVRKTAIEATGHLGDLRSVAPLSMLLIDKDKKIQVKTAEVLREYAQNDDARHIMGDIFLESINPDDFKGLRKSEKLLRIIGKEYAIARLADPSGDELKTILNYFDLLPLTYRSDDLSKLGRKALTEFKNRELVVNTLTSYALNQSNEDVKIREAINFLERLKDVSAAPLFVHILENASTFNLGEKRSACRFLGVIRFEKAAPLLRRMLSDNNENYTVRMDAARSLGRIEDKKAVKLLMSTMMSADENRELRQTVIYVLGTMREKKAVKYLITILEDNGADVRLRISSASALGRIGDERAIEPLVKASKSSSDYLKNAAQMALKNLQKRP